MVAVPRGGREGADSVVGGNSSGHGDKSSGALDGAATGGESQARSRGKHDGCVDGRGGDGMDEMD